MHLYLFDLNELSVGFMSRKNLTLVSTAHSSSLYGPDTLPIMKSSSVACVEQLIKLNLSYMLSVHPYLTIRDENPGCESNTDAFRDACEINAGREQAVSKF